MMVLLFISHSEGLKLSVGCTVVLAYVDVPFEMLVLFAII